MKEVCILGDGQLGKEIQEQTGWKCISRKKDGFDITKPEEWDKHLLKVEFGAIQHCPYSVIVNCIADTDTYSNKRDSHWNINYKGVDDLVEFCNKWKIKLIHISTDYLYGGGLPNKTENEVPSHCENWYSYTKLLGDAHVQLKSKNYLVIRCSFKPSPFPFEKAFNDVTGNFDYTDKIAKLIIKLITNKATGIFNVGTEAKTLYELAIKTNPKVLPTTRRGTPFPNSVLMNISKMKNFLKI